MNAGLNGRTVAETVGAVVDKCRAEGRTPMSALVDVAHAAGCDDALGNHDYCGGWMEANGEPTFDKLAAWATGIDRGFRLAAMKLAHLPSCHPVKVGDEFGMIVLEHRQTGEAAVIPFTDGTRQESRELANEFKATKDPRGGSWEERTYVFVYA